MLSGKGKGFGFFTLFFIVWATVIAILDLYFYARQNNSSYVLSSGTRTLMIILNGITVLVGAILAIYAIYLLISEWRHPKEAEMQAMHPHAHEDKMTCGIPKPMACAPVKVACKPACPPVKVACKPACVQGYDGSMLESAVNQLKCFVDGLNRQKEVHADQIKMIDVELGKAREQFSGACKVLPNGMGGRGGVDLSEIPMRAQRGGRTSLARAARRSAAEM